VGSRLALLALTVDQNRVDLALASVAVGHPLDVLSIADASRFVIIQNCSCNAFHAEGLAVVDLDIG